MALAPVARNFLPFALAVAFAASAAQAQGRSGIPEIDSLPLNDWHTPGKRLSYSKALTLSILPGGGQFYGSHPVRGGFLVGLETVLMGVAAYSLLVDIPSWREQARDALDSADALFAESAADPSRFSELEDLRREQVDFARGRMDLAAKQTDLANSELAWGLGLHIYGMLDALEIAYLSRHRDNRTRSPRRALFRGLMFPGGGQLYTRRYGKFGMLWMALGASAVSAWSRQTMVDDLNRRLKTGRAESALTGETGAVEELTQDRTLYRKRRNQYYWGMALFYFYAVLDGMVDASLSDFDAPQRFAITARPSWEGSPAWRDGLAWRGEG